MSAVDAAADALLRVAGRRWPAGLREPMTREWSAELAVLRTDRRLGRPTQAVRQLRYALSLACSPPVEDENGVPRGWRELLPVLGHRAQPVLMLLGVALLCRVLAGAGVMFGSALLEIVRGHATGMGPHWTRSIDWAAHEVSVGALALAAGIAAVVGGWLGRRVPVGWAHRTRLGRAGSAVLAPFVLAVGLAVVQAAAIVNVWFDGSVGHALWQTHVLGLLVWAALLAPLCWALVRLMRRGHGRWAVLVGSAGCVLVLEITAIAAGLHSAGQLGAAGFEIAPAMSLWWFPLTLLDPNGFGVGFASAEPSLDAARHIVGAVSATMRTLLVATAFAAWYGVRAARAEFRPVPVTPPPAPARPVPQALGRRLFGAAVTAPALLLWAYTVAILTPRIADQRAFDQVLGEELHIWAQEQREAAILLVVLGLLVALAGRGPVLLPAVAVGAVLMVADSVLDSADLAGPRVLAGTLALGVAVTAAGWSLSRALAPHPARRPGEAAGRRTLAAAAVVAALCAPALLFHAVSPGSATPAGFPGGTALAAGLLAALGAVAAMAAREAPLPIAARVTLLAAPVLLMAALGARSAADDRIVYATALGLPLVALAMGIMRWPREDGRTAARWTAIGAGAVVLAIPVGYLQLVPALLVGGALMRAAGYSFPVDGLPFLPGAILTAVPLAVLLAFLVVPRPAATPDPHATPLTGTGLLDAAS